MAETIAAPVAVEAQPPDSLGRRLLHALWPEVLVLIVFLALATRVFPGAWASPTRATIGGGGGDAGLFLWFLRWTPYAVGHGLNPLFTDYLNYPDGVNAMWNTSLPLPGLLLAPVTSTLGVVFTLNLLLTAALGLSAFSAYLAIRRYVPSDAAAAIGGLVFGFSPYILDQSRGHLHVTLASLALGHCRAGPGRGRGRGRAGPAGAVRPARHPAGPRARLLHRPGGAPAPRREHGPGRAPVGAAELERDGLAGAGWDAVQDAARLLRRAQLGGAPPPTARPRQRCPMFCPLSKSASHPS